MLYGSRLMASGECPEPQLFRGALPEVPRADLRVHRGEPVVLLWYAHTDGEAVRGMIRFEVADDRIARVRDYFYSPDVIAEICRERDAPCRLNGYRCW